MGKAQMDAGEARKVLGIGGNIDARNLRRVYRRKAMQCHPDKADEQDKDEMTQLMAQVNAAYTVLSDDPAVENAKNDEEIFQSSSVGLSQEEIEADEEIARLIKRWGAAPTMKQPIRARLELKEEATFFEIIDRWNEHGRLIHVSNAGQSPRQEKAMKALIKTSIEAKIPSAYRDRLRDWNGDDAFDGTISNGNYLDENGQEVKPPPKSAPSQEETGITVLCGEYESSFTQFCQNSDPEAIKVLSGDFNAALRNERKGVEGEIPDWNKISEAMEEAKAAREVRNETPKDLGKRTTTGQIAINPVYSWLHSRIEITKANFLVHATKCGFPTRWTGVYDNSIEKYPAINRERLKAIRDSAVASSEATGDDNDNDTEMPDALADPEPELKIRSFVPGLGLREVFAYDCLNAKSNPPEEGSDQCCRGGRHQVLIHVGEENAAKAVYYTYPAHKHRSSFIQIQQANGRNVYRQFGNSNELKGKTADDFDFRAVVTTARENPEEYTRNAKTRVYGSIDGGEYKFWNLRDLYQAFGEAIVDYKILECYSSAGVTPPVKLNRKLPAASGSRSITEATRQTLQTANKPSPLLHQTGTTQLPSEIQQPMIQGPAPPLDPNEFASMMRNLLGQLNTLSLNISALAARQPQSTQVVA